MSMEEAMIIDIDDAKGEPKPCFLIMMMLNHD